MEGFKFSPDEYWLKVNQLFVEKQSFLSLVVLIIATKVFFKLLAITLKLFTWLAALFQPMNYELDMTTKYYCKQLTEVDNILKRHRPKRQSAGASDCVTEQQSDHSEGQHNHAAGNNQTLSSAAGHSSASAPNKLDDDNVKLYPNGWLPVMESTKVARGTIKRAIILGRDVIVTRSVEGDVSVLDAYCAHVGVNIGIGGKVVKVDNESCVQCPFHGWTYRASDGQCVRIPYSNSSKNSIPRQAKLTTWICDEVDNFIYIWHHIDNHPPTWRFEPTKELLTKEWILSGRSCHVTNLELRDVLENGADMHHFEGIHNDFFLFGGDFFKLDKINHFQKYIRHRWDPSWNPVVDEHGKMTHVAEMTLVSWVTIMKMRVLDIEVRATQMGPACITLKYSSSWYGDGILKMNAVPLGGRRTMYVQHMYTKNTYFNFFVSKIVLYGEILQLERDFFMWNHKKDIENPVFVPEDKVLKRFRLWYGQYFKRKRRVIVQDAKETPNENSCKAIKDVLSF